MPQHQKPSTLTLYEVGLTWKATSTNSPRKASPLPCLFAILPFSILSSPSIFRLSNRISRCSVSRLRVTGAQVVVPRTSLRMWSMLVVVKTSFVIAVLRAPSVAIACMSAVEGGKMERGRTNVGWERGTRTEMLCSGHQYQPLDLSWILTNSLLNLVDFLL